MILKLVGAAILATVIGFGSGFLSGAAHQRAKDNVAALNAKIATLEFDAAEAIKKAAQAEDDAARIAAADWRNQEKINAAEAILAGSYPCITVAERDWLRSIAKARTSAKPPPGPGLHAAGAGARCDTWPGYTARVIADQLKTNDIIVRSLNWYEGLRVDVAKGAAK